MLEDKRNMAYNLERNKGKVSDIKQNIDTKQNEFKDLEKNKDELLEAGIEIQNSNIDENVQENLMNQINQALEANAEKGDELADEMNLDAKDLEDIKQETQESVQSNITERKNLEKKQKLLDKFGLGNKLDNAISELDDNKAQLEDFNQSLIDAGQKIDQVSQKLRSL